jgi:tRNA A37 threonylcarbamoyltransferase TsaD
MSQNESWEKEFDRSFPGLKSVGHKMIHKDNHNAHDGSSCSSECKYVGQSIKSFIKRLISTREKEIAEEVKGKEKEIADELFGWDCFPGSDKQAKKVVEIILSIFNHK